MQPRLSKKIISYLTFLFILICITIFFNFVKYQNQIINFVGEKMFLECHQNKLALSILNFDLPGPLLVKEGGSAEEQSYRYFLLGRIYFVENQLFKSINAYSKAIEINPKHKESYYGRGLAYGFLGELFLIQAENDFLKYLELEGGGYAAAHSYGAWAGYNDLAWIYFLKGEFVNAEKVARQGLEISNLNPWLLNILAVSLLEQGQKNCKEANILFNNSKLILENTDTEKFGEAYSGDQPDFWELGKKQMQKTIDENLQICKTDIY